MTSPAAMTSRTLSTSDSPYTAKKTDGVLFVDTGSGSVVINLPAATTVGRGVIIKDSGGSCSSTSATINADGSDTIDGAASAAVDSNYFSLSLVVRTPGSWSIV